MNLPAYKNFFLETPSMKSLTFQRRIVNGFSILFTLLKTWIVTVRLVIKKARLLGLTIIDMIIQTMHTSLIPQVVEP